MKQTEKEILDLFFKVIPEKSDVLLMASPLFWTGVPSLGLHLLQASCRHAGISAYVLYTNLLYSIITGPYLHTKIALKGEEYLLLGERLFAASTFGQSAVFGCMDKFSDPKWTPDHTLKIAPDMASRVPEALAPYREWIGNVDWEHLELQTTSWVQTVAKRIVNMGCRVLGCSTSHSGMVPAIALLDNIKKENPNLITVIGGTLCEDEMAEGIISLKSGIDYVFSGEGELTFPDFVKKILAGQLPEGKIIYGKPAANLDSIQIPDYREYFDQLKKLPTDQPSPECIEIPYETSRGCWYGKCTFCSMAGKNNLYRKKSADKISNDLQELIERYGMHSIFMTDNIMPSDYFDTLIPGISKKIPSISFRYEMKAGLTLAQVLSLKKAGAARIDPGIESLSSSLLKRMRKGVTAGENLALLRCLRSTKLDVSWNFLFGFPGDEVGEYDEMLGLLPLIRHLPPPNFMLPLVLCRFSPYHTSPEMFGISNLRPAEVYENIFPSHADLEKIAYYFTGDFKTQSLENPGIIIALAKEIQAWKKAWSAYETVPVEMMLPALHITRINANEYVLEDTRGLPGRPERMVLDREQADILLVPRPRDTSVDFLWAVDAQLAIVMDSWYIPLSTADPELLMEFERGL